MKSDITENYTKKGGLNDKPIGERPSPPIGQGTQPTDAQHSNGAGPAEICPRCGGSGKVEPKCSECHGTGVVVECGDDFYSLKDCPNGCHRPGPNFAIAENVGQL